MEMNLHERRYKYMGGQGVTKGKGEALQLHDQGKNKRKKLGIISELNLR